MAIKSKSKAHTREQRDTSIFAEAEPRRREALFPTVSKPKKNLFKRSAVVTPGAVTHDMLSDEQKLALDKMETFVHSTEKQMVFAGYAGTGKSTTTRFLLDYLDDTTLKTVCTAPTNEAVRVISKQSGRQYGMTIYSLLGLRLEQDDDSSPYLKVVAECKLKNYDIVIVDECSMINSNLYQMILGMLDQFSHVKIIYVGDPAQLPPVNDPLGISPTFYIKPENWAFLTSIQRTAKDNPIIQLVTAIRDNLASSHDVFSRDTQVNAELGVGVEFIDNYDQFTDRMIEQFKSHEFKSDPNHVRALAYTNATVNDLNNKVRRAVYGVDVSEYIEGEIVLVDEPIMDDSGLNVTYTVGERLRIDSCELVYDDKIGIKYWRMEVTNYEAERDARITCDIEVVHSAYTEKYRKSLSSFAETAKRNVIALGKKDAWKPFFRMKNRFAKLKYIYAITVHTSQGSTFKNAFVVNSDLDILRWNNVERNKLKYVAFTRASHRLVIC